MQRGGCQYLLFEIITAGFVATGMVRAASIIVTGIAD